MLRTSHDRTIVAAGAKLTLVVVLPDAVVVCDIRTVVGSGCATTSTGQHLGVTVDVVLWRALVNEVRHGVR